MVIKSRKAKTYRCNSLTVAEQQLLLSVTDTFEDLSLFKLALTTGIRREDIVNIDRGNIDLVNHSLRFWDSKKRRWWDVPLTDDVAQTLKRFINTQGDQKKLFSMTGRTAYNRLQKCLRKAGIRKHLSFHDLRRSMVKTAKRQGLSPKAVSQIIGDSLAVVDRYYTNLDQYELKEEIDKL